jgi:multiple sugar transport system permease protein
MIVVGAALYLLYPSRRLDSKVPSKDVVEIAYMGPGGPLAGSYADVVREFERKSEIDHAKDPSKPIYRVISGQDAQRDQTADPTRFLISVAGGMPPDVITFDRYAITEWSFRGAFVPLDDYIARDLAAGKTDAPNSKDYYPACWNEGMYNGKLYAIPVAVDDRALVYNKDLLKRAGLVDEKGEAKPPKDWDELREYAKKLTEFDENGRMKVLGFAPLWGNSWLYMYSWMNGGEFMAQDGRKCIMNDPRNVEALQYIVDLYDEAGGYDKVSAFQAGFQNDALDPFVQGKVAMKIDGSWIVAWNLAKYCRDLNYGVAPPPLPKSEIAKGRKTVSWCGGYAYAIPTTAKHKDAAWEFIKFITSTRSLGMIAELDRELAESEGRLYVPGQSPQIKFNEETFEKYIYSNPRAAQKIKDACRVYNDLLNYARFRPVTPVGQLLWMEHVNATDAAVYHSMTPKAALDHATAAVERDLDRVLTPSQGPLFSTNWFIIGYALLLIVAATIVYQWDTRPEFRARTARLLHLKKNTDVVEGSGGGYFRKQWGGGFVSATPWIIGFIVFGGAPMLFSLFMSFCDYDILNPPRFVGLHNYQWMFTQDNLLPKALWNTLYMVIGVPLGMAMSLAIALLLNLKVRGIAVWRTFFYMPAIVPMVAASILWIWIFNPEGGLLNQALRCIGIGGPLWLQDPVWAKPSIIIMGLWTAGGGMIIWIAGLKGIDEQLYEAASIDGANAWQKFMHITIPQLTPYIFFNLVMGLIGTFQIFGQAFIMTQGGPVNSTLFYVYHLFNNAFRYGHMGYASAMAWALFAIVLILTIIQFRISKKWVHYEAE